MNTRTVRNLIRMLPLALAALFSGCSTMDARKEVVAQTQAMRKGPESAPVRSITNFSSGLRCMDNLLVDYGVRDVAVIVEDIVDETKKVNAGTKDMLLSAVSDMTRRSRAIRLIAFGKDSGNTIGFLTQAEQRNIYAAIPQYSIKGSISQFDDNLVKKNVDAGFSIEPFISLGAASTSGSSVLGLDLSVLSTQDLSLVSGVTSRNQVVLFKDGKGFDGDATIKKFGINFNMSVGRNEGQSQALRTLVELAAIELVGKLAKVPYWTCVGADPNDEAIKLEIADWYESMRANPEELFAWFQTQMRERGLYNGPIDGNPNQAFKDAVAAHRAALGLSREPKLSQDYLGAYLNTDHRTVVATVAPAAAAPAATPAAAAASIAPIGLVLSTVSGSKSLARGEQVKLIVTPARDAYVYCYLYDESRKIQRFYPNRFAKDALVRVAAPLELPGKMRFQLIANDKGLPETVACFATERDVMKDLPAIVGGADFENLPVDSLEQVKRAFASAAGPSLGQAYFNFEFR